MAAADIHIFCFLRDFCHLSADRQDWPAGADLFVMSKYSDDYAIPKRIMHAQYYCISAPATIELIKSRHVCAWDMVL
jgi:hypothetical protein